MDLSSEQTEVLKRGLVELMREIHSGRLETAIRITEGWALDETPSGEFTSGGEVSDPTGNRAVNQQRRDPEHALLMSMLESVEQSTNDVVKKVRELQPVTGVDADRFKRKLNAQAMTLAPCASVLCDDQAPVNHRHCEPCAAYLDAHPNITQVPRSTILERAKKRKQREAGRIHVTGPLKEEIA